MDFILYWFWLCSRPEEHNNKRKGSPWKLNAAIRLYHVVRWGKQREVEYCLFLSPRTAIWIFLPQAVCFESSLSLLAFCKTFSKKSLNRNWYIFQHSDLVSLPHYRQCLCFHKGRELGESLKYIGSMEAVAVSGCAGTDKLSKRKV